MMRVLAPAAILLASSATALVAQAPDTAAADTVRLPGVTAIATRAPARLLDVPLAVTLVPREAYRDAAGLRIEQALRGVPGVLAQSRSGGMDVRITIRGYGARGAGDRSNAGTTRGIRILQDGFPETEPDGRTALDLIDLSTVEEVEVVRSNASAVWGNAAGGVVGFSSVPLFSRPFAAVERQQGSFGLASTVARAGQPLGAGRAYVVAARALSDGWRANSAAERTLVNAGVIAPVGGRTLLRVHAVAADNAFEIPGPLTRAVLDSAPQLANATYLSRHERRRNRLGRLGAAVEHRAGEGLWLDGTLFVQPKALQRSERGTFRDFTRYHLGGSASLRWENALGVRGAFSAGVDQALQDGAILFYSLAPEGTRGTELRDNKREGANNFGVFAQEVLSLGARVDLTLGARWDAIAYDYESRIDPRLNDRKSFERLSPKLGLLVRLTPESSLYAALGGGVEAPAGNETDPASTFGQDTVTALNPLLEPIRSTTWEIGGRHLRASGDGFVRALGYDAALYWTEVRNEIVPYRGGRFYFTAGSVQRRGAELGVQVRTAPGVSLETAVSGQDHRYTAYVVDSVHYGRAGATADYSGNRVVGVPGVFGSAAVRWTPAFRDELELDLGLQHAAGYWADDANTVRVPGYALWSAGVALRRPVRLGGGVTARGAVRVENLADRRYVASAFLNPDVVSGEPVAFEPGLPRQVVVSVSLGAGR
jgi:iron complex outermembrane receptor protein